MLFRLICSVLISSLLLSNLFVFGQITQIPQSVSGGTAGAGKFAATVSSSTTWTVLGTTHGLATADIGVFVSFDTGTAYTRLEPDDCSVHKTTYDVTCTFSVAQAGRILLVGGTSSGGGGGDEFQANKNQNNGYMGLDGSARAAKANQNAQTVYADQTITWGSRTGYLAMALGALGLPSGTARPATCAVGEIFFDTDATSGQRVYGCESTNTWVLQGDGGTLSNHATQHQHSGGDEVATATPGANAIPKALAGGTLATGWLPAGTVGVREASVSGVDLASLASTCEGSDRTISVAGANVGEHAIIVPPITNDLRMIYPAYVSAPGIVSWRACSIAATIDNISGTYAAKVFYVQN